MRILVIGSGGREHALAWRLSHAHEVFAAPGNPGIAQDVTVFPVRSDNFSGLLELATRLAIELVVVGPEDPLVNGLADVLRSAGFAVYGPGADGAQLEGSKAFSKDLMASAGIPTADFQTFTESESAREYARCKFGQGRPVVVKASGNALGKGVIVAADLDEALDAIERMMVAAEFGEAGRTVVLEERLPGPEFSLLTICSGTRFRSLPVAQDYKRIRDADQGPNTGGMGSYSPVAWVSEAQVTKTEAEVVEPALRELVTRGIDYRGTLFSGLMMDGDRAACLEFNVRFGDPETQTLMMRVGDEFGDLLYAAAVGSDLPGITISNEAAVTVVVASEGYPGPIERGQAIQVNSLPPGVKVFHAGTADRDGQLVTSGGRVLGISALAPTVAEARALAYQGVQALTFPGMQFRTDIGV